MQRKKVVKKSVPMLKCSTCGVDKKYTEFFASRKKIHEATGRLPICKSCIVNMSCGEDGLLDKDRFLKVLKTIDRPFIQRAWEYSMVSNSESKVGIYMKYISVGDYRNMSWADSEISQSSIHSLNDEEIKQSLKQTVEVKEDDPEFIRPEIYSLFGAGFDPNEYVLLQKKYDALIENYPTPTAMHVEALTSYIKLKVREEVAIAKGDVGEAKTWAAMAGEAARAAKIRPDQLSKADLQGGLTTVGEISQFAEEQADIIKVLPEFKYRPADAVDFCIYSYINYVRDLQGLPLVEYSDVYKFYDEMKDTYIKEKGDPNGIFKEDPTEKNRPLIENFIKVEEKDDE